MDGPQFFLGGVVKDKDDLVDFEGPLSLILLLLQKNKIEIRDISISDILDQYVAYLDKLQQMDLEITSEFVQMASYLLYIKTKMLLTSEEEPVSELEELMNSLEQLQAKDTFSSVKEVTPELLSRYQKGALFFSKAPEAMPKEASNYRYSHEPVDLLKALLTVFKETKEIPADQTVILKAIPHPVTYSIKRKSRDILNRLRIGDVTLMQLYRECETKSEMIATLLSVLELCSIGSIHLEPSEYSTDIELSYAGGNMEEILNQMEE